MQYNSCYKTEKNYREEKRGGKEAGSIEKKNAQGSRWKRSVKSARRKFIICTVQCLRSLLSTYTAAEVLFYLLQKALHFSPSQNLCSLNLLHFPQQRQRLKKQKKDAAASLRHQQYQWLSTEAVNGKRKENITPPAIKGTTHHTPGASPIALIY